MNNKEQKLADKILDTLIGSRPDGCANSTKTLIEAYAILKGCGTSKRKRK